MDRKTDHTQASMGIAESPTVTQWLEQWLEIEKQHLAEASAAKYSQLIHGYLRPAFGAKDLIDLSDEDVSRFYTALEDRDLSPQTMHLIFTILRRGLHLADGLRIVPWNVCEGQYIPRRSYSHGDLLPGLLVRDILRKKIPQSCENLFPLMLISMLRFGEIAGLSWDDVDFEHHTIQIRQQLLTYYDHGHVRTAVHQDLKKHQARTISLPPFAFRYFESEKEKQEEDRRRDETRWSNPQQLIFTDLQGMPLRHYKVTRRWKSLLSDLGYADFPLHALCHTGAALFYAATGDMPALRLMTGRSAIGAAAYYTQTLEPVLRGGQKGLLS